MDLSDELCEDSVVLWLGGGIDLPEGRPLSRKGSLLGVTSSETVVSLSEHKWCHVYLAKVDETLLSRDIV